MELSKLSPVAGSTQVGKRKGRGPGSGNACSLWEMCEFEPTYNDYLVTVLGDASATVTSMDRSLRMGLPSELSIIF